MGREDADEILVGQDRVMERVEHLLGIGPGVLGTEQVRPADRPDQQRTAGEHQDRLVGPARVGDRVGDVLGGVAGRVDDPEAQAPTAATSSSAIGRCSWASPAPAPMSCSAPVAAASSRPPDT